MEEDARTHSEKAPGGAHGVARARGGARCLPRRARRRMRRAAGTTLSIALSAVLVAGLMGAAPFDALGKELAESAAQNAAGASAGSSATAPGEQSGSVAGDGASSAAAGAIGAGSAADGTSAASGAGASGDASPSAAPAPSATQSAPASSLVAGSDGATSAAPASGASASDDAAAAASPAASPEASPAATAQAASPAPSATAQAAAAAASPEASPEASPAATAAPEASATSESGESGEPEAAELTNIDVDCDSAAILSAALHATPATVGDCIYSEGDEGRGVVYRVTAANEVYVGSGVPGSVKCVNYPDEYDENDKLVRSYTFTTVTPEYSGRIIVPQTVEYAGTVYTVAGVSAYAFSSEGTTPFRTGSVVLPATVRTIGERSFDSSTAFADGIYIDESESASQLQSIGAYAFNGNSMPSFTVPSSVTEIGQGAFSGSAVTGVYLQSPSQVTLLPESCFAGCGNLATFAVPESVVRIESECFAESGIESFTLPKTVKSLGTGVFRASGLSDFAVQEGSPITAVPESTFAECASLAAFEVPSWISSVEYGAFRGSGLVSFTAPATLAYLGEYAFADCRSLASFAFAEGHGLLELNEGVFSGCKSLSAIELPANMRTIHENAFAGCTSLASIAFPAKMETIAGFSFSRCTGLRCVVFEGDAAAISMEASAFYLSNAIESVIYLGKRSKNITFPSSIPTVYYTVSFYTTRADVESGAVQERFIVQANAVPATAAAQGAVYHGDYPESCDDVPEAYEGFSWAFESGFGLTGELTDSFYAYGNASSGPLSAGDTFQARTEDGNMVTYTVTAAAQDGAHGTASAGTAACATGDGPCVDANATGAITLPEEVLGSDASYYDVTAIMPYAFANAKRIVQVSIPRTVTQIGAYAFFRCTQLRNVYFESDASAISGDSIFASCANIELVVYGGKKANVSYGVSSPDVYYTVYYYESKHDYQIGNVEERVIAHERTLLDSPAETDLREGAIPELKTGWEWRYEDGFGGTVPLTDSTSVYASGLGIGCTVEVRNGNVTETECRFTVLSLDEQTHTGTVAVGLAVDGTPAINTAVSGIPVIPATVTDEDGNAYSVTGVTEYAFGATDEVCACQYITGVDLPDTVAEIGACAFRECHALKAQSIPAAVKTIGERAFQNCTALISVSIPSDAQLTAVPAHCFSGDVKLASFDVPSNVVAIEEYAFSSCTDDTVDAEEPASACVGIRSLQLDHAASLKRIGRGAFAGDSRLAGALVLPDGLETVESFAFRLAGIGSISFPASLKSVGGSAFRLCSSVASIRFRGDAQDVVFGKSAFDFYKGEKDDDPVGSLSEVHFDGKKAPDIEDYIVTGTMENRDTDPYGRTYRFYYTLGFYGSEEDYLVDLPARRIECVEDSYGRDYAPSVPEYSTWRCELGFSLNDRVQDSYYAIMGFDLAYAVASGLDASYYYTGYYITPLAVLTMPDGTVLSYGVDYELDDTYGDFNDGYTDNLLMSDVDNGFYARIHYRGIGAFGGTLSVPFVITGTVDGSQTLSASLDDVAYTYDGTAHEPGYTVTATVKDEPYPVSEGTDYTVSYRNNVNAGTASLVVTGTGYIFEGEQSVSFAIAPANLSRCTMGDYTVQKGEDGYTFSFTLTAPWGETLSQGTDYTTKYVASNENEGVLLVSGTGNYTGALAYSVGSARSGGGTGGGTGGGGTGGGGGGGSGGGGTGGGSGGGRADDTRSVVPGSVTGDAESASDETPGDGDVGPDRVQKAALQEGGSDAQGGSDKSVWRISALDTESTDEWDAGLSPWLLILLVAAGAGLAIQRRRYAMETGAVTAQDLEIDE